MTLELINPEGLSSPLSYTHVVAAKGSRLVFVAGQVADDANGNLVGDDDLAAQAHQAFANVGRALAAVGARPDHVGEAHDLRGRPSRRVPARHLGGADRGLRRPQAGRRDRRR